MYRKHVIDIRLSLTRINCN